jgi:ABC-type phosphate transport system substrate-binding protein
MIARKKWYDNESAVSVLVGTLALIAVVIAGTIGIASIVGAFSTDVSKHASPDASVAATQTPIYIAGSDNMDGLTRSLAISYAEENSGVRIVSGILVPDGVYPAIISKTVDIGALAGLISYTDITKNPDIRTTQIGSSAVVIITNKATPGITNINNPLTVPVIKALFTNNALGANLDPNAKAVTRSDVSGTADTFYNSFLGMSTLQSIPGGAPPQNSDSDLISYVAATPYAIGFADYGDVESAINNNAEPISIIKIQDALFTYSSSNYDDIKVAAKYQYLSTQRHADGSIVWTGTQADVPQYPLTLCYPLNYVTKDKPNTLQQGFLDYVTSPAARPAFIRANVFPVADF